RDPEEIADRQQPGARGHAGAAGDLRPGHGDAAGLRRPAAGRLLRRRRGEPLSPFAPRFGRTHLPSETLAWGRLSSGRRDLSELLPGCRCAAWFGATFAG